MIINEEKQYIYEMMKSLIEERRTITDIYFQLKKRLESLEEIETKGLDTLSVKGYIDFYNEKERNDIKKNLKRELTHLSETAGPPAANPSVSSVIPSFEIAEQKFRDNNRIVKNPSTVPEKKNKSKQGRTNSEKTEYIYGLIFDEMKSNKDRAFTAKEIYDKLLAYQKFRDYNIDINQFRSNIFYRICIKNPDILKKVGSGKYQYFLDRNA